MGRLVTIARLATLFYIVVFIALGVCIVEYADERGIFVQASITVGTDTSEQDTEPLIRQLLCSVLCSTFDPTIKEPSRLFASSPPL